MTPMPAVGERYEPVHGYAYSDGNSPTDPPRGFYPLLEDGKTLDVSVRLRWIDDAPDNPDDGRGHFEVMRSEAGVGYFHGAAGHDFSEPAPPPPPEEQPQGGGMMGQVIVPLEAHVEGKAETSVGGNKLRYLFRGKQ